MDDQDYYEYTIEDELISEQIRNDELKQKEDEEYLYQEAEIEPYITVILKYRKGRNKPRKTSKVFYGEKRLELINKRERENDILWYTIDLYADIHNENIKNNTNENNINIIEQITWKEIEKLPEFNDSQRNKIINKLWEEWWDDKEVNGETKEKNDIYIKKMLKYLYGLTTKHTFKFYKNLLFLPIEKNKIYLSNNYYLKYYSNEFWDFNEVYKIFYKVWKDYTPEIIKENYTNFAWILNKFVKQQFNRCLQKAKKGRFTYKSKNNSNKKFIQVEVISMDEKEIDYSINSHIYRNQQNKIELDLFIKEFCNKYLNDIDNLIFSYMLTEFSDDAITFFLRKYKISIYAIRNRKMRIRKLFKQYLKGTI